MLTLSDQASPAALAPVPETSQTAPARQYDQRPMAAASTPGAGPLSPGLWGVPPTVGCDQLVRLWRPPGAGHVLEHGHHVTQHGVHDPPGLLDVVLAREAGGIAPHRVEQELFVGPHLGGVAFLADDELDRFPFELIARFLHQRADRDHAIGCDPETKIVGRRREPREDRRRLAQLDEDFGGRHRQALARSDVERHALPPPRVDLESERHEGFYLRLRPDARLVAIAAKLTADDIPRVERTNPFQHLGLFVPHHLGVQARRRLHGDVRDDLQEMVLHDVAQGPRLIVELAASLHAERLCHRDLHALDVLPIPDRLEERVRKAEEEQVLNRVLAQVVVDAEHAVFTEGGVDDRVQRAGRGEVVPEWLLDDDTRASRTPRLAELMDDRLEQAGWDGEIVRRVLRVAQLPAELLKGRRVAVVAVDVAQAAAEMVERARIEAAMLRDAVLGSRLELIELPAGFGHADHRDVEVAPLGQRLEGGEDLLVRKISGRTEEHQRIGTFLAHRPASFFVCPSRRLE